MPKVRQIYIVWALKIGLIQENDKYYKKLLNVETTILSAFFSPDIELDKLNLNSYLQLFFFAFDDIVDNKIDFERVDQHREFAKVTDIFIDILAGKYEEVNGLPNFNFPLFIPLCHALMVIRFEAISSGIDITYFIKRMAAYIKAVAWEHFNPPEPESLSKESFKFRRSITAGVYPTIEAVNLIRKTNIFETVRNYPLYKKIIQQICDHVFLVNDIFSLKKEIINGEKNNLILIKAHKYSLQASFNKVVQKANELVIEFNKSCSLLEMTFPNDTNLLNFILSMKYFIDGHIYWYEHSKRYGDIEFKYYKVEQKDTPGIFFPAKTAQLYDENIRMNDKAVISGSTFKAKL